MISVSPVWNNVCHMKSVLKGKPIRQIACTVLSWDYYSSKFLLLTVALTLSSLWGPGDTSALPCCKILHRNSTVHWWLQSETTLIEIKRQRRQKEKIPCISQRMPHAEKVLFPQAFQKMKGSATGCVFPPLSKTWQTQKGNRTFSSGLSMTFLRG